MKKKKISSILILSTIVSASLIGIFVTQQKLTTRAEKTRYIEPAIPELVAPPIEAPNETMQTMSPMFPDVGSHPESCMIQIEAVLAMDETFLSYYYYTPNYGILNGYLYAQLQIARASVYFEQVFDTGIEIVGTTTWERTTNNAIDAFDELLDETGFERVYNTQCPDILIAYTHDPLFYGPNEIFGLADQDFWACMQRPVVYWVDENLVQHEVSHLCGAEDGLGPGGPTWCCYESNCIMSYRLINNLETWTEDGHTWEINVGVCAAHLYNDWCDDCYETINLGKWTFYGDYYYIPGHPCVGGC